MDDSTATGPLASVMASPIDRRTALKRGAVVGGALLWTTPVVQALSVRVADAASVVTGDLPSHGVALVRRTGTTDKPFAVKVDEGSPNVVTGPNNSSTQDTAQLNEKFGVNNWRQPTEAELELFEGLSGVGNYSGPTASGPGLYIQIPAGYSFVDGYAYTFDGQFQNQNHLCGDGDKYTNAFLSAGTVWFLKTCNEPTTGE